MVMEIKPFQGFRKMNGYFIKQIRISIAQSTTPIKDEKRFAAEPRRDSSGNTFLTRFGKKKIAANSPKQMFIKASEFILLNTLSNKLTKTSAKTLLTHFLCGENPKTANALLSNHGLLIALENQCRF